LTFKIPADGPVARFTVNTRPVWLVVNQLRNKTAYTHTRNRIRLLKIYNRQHNETTAKF